MSEDFQLAWHDGADWPEWGSAPRRPLVALDGAHKGEWLDSVIGPHPVTAEAMVYHVLRCELCIGTHIWPLPSSAALTTFYATTFYQHAKPAYVERYERDRDWWERCVHGPILDQCVQLLHQSRHVLTSRPYMMLDVGAGPGIALDVAAQRHHMTTFGLEPNADLCTSLSRRGHCMTAMTLEQWQSAGMPHSEIGASTSAVFQILYLYEVLEHQPCPEAFLLQCYDLVDHDGLIVIVVPNDYNPLQLQAMQKYKMQRSWWVHPPEHLWYFTPKTLQLLVRRCGFQVMDMRGTFPLEKFLLQDYNYIGDDTMGRKVHQWRMQDELWCANTGQLEQRFGSYRFNLQSRIGREIVCIARKP